MAKIDIIKAYKLAYTPLEEEIAKRKKIYEDRSEKWKCSDSGDSYWSEILELEDQLRGLREFVSTLIAMK
jgi:hypothetical protein